MDSELVAESVAEEEVEALSDTETLFVRVSLAVSDCVALALDDPDTVLV